MAGDEYSIGGGKLKLKGSKVSGGRIEKKKKKSSKKKEEKAGSPEENTKNSETGLEKSDKDEAVRSEDREQDTPGKTETEKKYEEIRRKRLHERLQRDGVKTHKERVEDLNKYLSRLSEHHDMPKIGPG
ncbi:unnamed protein product [Penicillium salamii]|uniref:DUF1754-domain-containing protein n=1 Tax=Penicillium salamii TaxID=1612424 RepID=A0A9W4JQT9_9EURO|nr:unnamed protein product [Penicillium salamii]CAG8097753.1 unnamed protein product [Penicillium salamii]CAG8172863.1 unnamed protein product [Penicillium salamii]CAG8218871.1 unnamed protein product [Penicillium salamii]CAG8227935.1 unnamed protein product [Penicillium salamii]